MGEKKDNIILIGFMGSGKSTTGIGLSYRLKRTLIDTDKMIEKREKKSISEIFALQGEEYFREKETELLREFKKERTGRIFSAGGGTPLKAENRRLLRELGTVVYLKVSAETVYERLKGDTTRPLLRGDDPLEKIRTLLREREERYRDAADIVIEADKKKTAQVVKEIAAAFQRIKAGKIKEGTSMKILIINGPNLNFLGIREKEIYGTKDYDALLRMIAEKGEKEGCEIEVFQSNHEGALIDRIQDAYFDGTQGLIINPGAYTHYSYAVHDALASVTTMKKVEVHISDITAREEFRKISVTAPACDKQICGEGLDGYLSAIDFLLNFKENS